MKKKKPIKSKRKTCDVFHQKPYSKTNVTQKSRTFWQHRFVVHDDDDDDDDDDTFIKVPKL